MKLLELVTYRKILSIYSCIKDTPELSFAKALTISFEFLLELEVAAFIMTLGATTSAEEFLTFTRTLVD